MPRILITTDYLRPGDDVDQYLREHGHTTVHLPMTGRRDPEELAAALDGIDAALVANEPLTAEVLSRASGLRAIVRTGVGYDSIDIDTAGKLGITVSNLPGINANAVAEYTMGLLLATARRLVQSAVGVAVGGWPREDGHELRGSTLGLIGYGAAARALIPLAQAFGMGVLCTTNVPAAQRTDDPLVRFVDLPELLSTADYISVHTALTKRTRGLLDASAFRRMKPTAVLVNTARGAVVDEQALADAVRTGQIAAAALDVVNEEPLTADSPLRNVDGITVFSHLAGQTAEARAAAGLEGAAEAVAALAGHPRFAVNTHLLPHTRPARVDG
ncbi:phosphoglycerate dehydrogenase [Streptomyces sp. NPDC096048]|uniref:phosphoglycerate dehydrogenase n=1 Tax=Streptomyces sp. NPDC096048 TaxID=3366072 RepID=UPI003829D995